MENSNKLLDDLESIRERSSAQLNYEKEIQYLRYAQGIVLLGGLLCLCYWFMPNGFAITAFEYGDTAPSVFVTLYCYSLLSLFLLLFVFKGLTTTRLFLKKIGWYLLATLLISIVLSFFFIGIANEDIGVSLFNTIAETLAIILVLFLPAFVLLRLILGYIPMFKDNIQLINKIFFAIIKILLSILLVGVAYIYLGLLLIYNGGDFSFIEEQLPSNFHFGICYVTMLLLGMLLEYLLLGRLIRKYWMTLEDKQH